MRALLVILAITALFIPLFVLYPELDVAVSSLVYREETGFIYATDPFVRAVYDAVPIATKFLIATLLLLLLLIVLRSRLAALSQWRLPGYRPVVFLLLCLILGPGVAVHQVVKEGVGRPRPDQTIPFGGEKSYIPPFHISEYDGKSFVSGHAAMGYYVAAFALLSTGRLKTFLYGGSILLGLGVGAGRLLQGRHFLSDILFSGSITLIVIHLVYLGIYRQLRATPRA